MSEQRRVIIIGGGASGIFAAIQCKEYHPDFEVIVLERTGKLLSKVKISGGGRCNVTNATTDNRFLITNYPRGEKELKGPFSRFAVLQTIDWFNKNGVELKTESDGRMFPVTDSSQTIIDCFLKKLNALNIAVIFNETVVELIKNENDFNLITAKGNYFKAHNIIVATGGNANAGHYKWLEACGHSVVPPVPSLFTFNIPQSTLKGLEGVAFKNVVVKIADTRLHHQGPVLITHWGLSGPAVLKLSAQGALILHKLNYRFKVSLDFVDEENEEALLELLQNQKKISAPKRIAAQPMFNLPARFWERICHLSEIENDLKWADISNKKINRLCMRLKNFEMQVEGKTTFKEEFVTAGGIELREIDLKTMESKKIRNLFFCGEVMNVDGLTGGFNFQHAWTSGYLAGISCK